VAIKILLEAFARDAERISRFEREARILASLNRPGSGVCAGRSSQRRKVADLDFGRRGAAMAPRWEGNLLCIGGPEAGGRTD
jgi:hypothetical protein